MMTTPESLYIYTLSFTSEMRRAGIYQQSVFRLQAAKAFVDGKKTMAALGHHTNTPFVDEI